MPDIVLIVALIFVLFVFVAYKLYQADKILRGGYRDILLENLEKRNET